MNLPTLSAPVRLSAEHDCEAFSCGEPTLDVWLKEQARKNEGRGASRTYAVCHGSTVVGYYCLANGAVDRSDAPKRLQRNMPDPIPVMVLGRLATDQRYQGQGIGKGQLRDAILRVLQAAEIAGIRALLVHAISDEARQFYLGAGFLDSPTEPLMLCLPLETARQAIG
ncbi:MAG: GNAT family N-acetyltransferase [Thermomicrobiales bacterium]